MLSKAYFNICENQSDNIDKWEALLSGPPTSFIPCVTPDLFVSLSSSPHEKQIIPD